MPHFGIESLGHGTGGFLDTITTSPIVTGLTGTTTITGTATAQATASQTFQDAKTIIDNILGGLRLPESEFQRVTSQNLIGLGEAAIDISGALSEQVTIREDQLSRTNDTILNQQLQLNNLNERVSSQLSELGQSIGGFDPLKFFTDNPLFLGLGVGGLAVAGVVLLLVLR